MHKISTWVVCVLMVSPPPPSPRPLPILTVHPVEFLYSDNARFFFIITLAVHQNDRIEILLQQAGNYLAESEIFETHKDFVSALSYCSEAASE